MPKRRNGVFAEVRLQKICTLLQEKGEVSVAELCEKFSTSSATIRSDLAKLEALNQLKRTHGGAILMDGFDRELTTKEKRTQNIAAKAAIAKRALEYIQPGSAVALDTGTTVLELAKRMQDIHGLTAITNDVEIAQCLEQAPDIDILLLGGLMRKQFHCTVGTSVLQTLDQLNIDTLFLATNGLSLQHGLSTPSIEMANIKKRLIEISRKVILLVDQSKLEVNSFVNFAQLSDVDVLITDADIGEALKKEAGTAHIEFAHVSV